MDSRDELRSPSLPTKPSRTDHRRSITVHAVRPPASRDNTVSRETAGSSAFPLGLAPHSVCDMNRIGLSAVAITLSVAPLGAADFKGVIPSATPPAVAEVGAVVAPPPPGCRAAVVSGLFVGP